MKLWKKDIESSAKVEQFTVGRDLEFDIFLAPFDVQGSLAHTAMLESIGLLTAEEKELKRKIRLAITQIKRLSICLSDFIYMTKKRENCLDDVVSNPDAKFFRDVTGITKDEFNYLCDLELIRRDKLEENILDFYFQEVASLISEEFVSKEIKKLNKIAA